MRLKSRLQAWLPALPVLAVLTAGVVAACSPSVPQQAVYVPPRPQATGSSPPIAIGSVSPSSLVTPSGSPTGAVTPSPMPCPTVASGVLLTPDGRVYARGTWRFDADRQVYETEAGGSYSATCAPTAPSAVVPVPCPTPGGEGSLYWPDGTHYQAGQWDYLWAKEVYATYDGKSSRSCNGAGFAAVWSPFEVDWLDDGSLKLVDGTILAPGRFRNLGNGLYQAEWGTYYLGKGTMSQARPSIAPLPPGTWRPGYLPSPSASPSGGPSVQ